MNPVYLDHNATTPVRAEARRAWLDALEACGNASSVHFAGREARARLDAARETVAECLGASPREVVFTSGGTEGDNLAVAGAVFGALAGGRCASLDRAHVVTTAIEHPAVLAPCAWLESLGVRVTRVAPGADGRVDAAAVADAIDDDTVVVSVMWVNNETGVVQPVAEVARAARARGVLVHTDAVQAFGRIAVDVRQAPVDLLTISGHKFGAPVGTGALYVRRGTRLEPVLHGGGQEWGLRSGTHNVAGAAALAAAARAACAEREALSARLAALRDRIEREVTERIEGATVHGARAPRVSNTTSVRFAGADGEAVLLGLDAEGIAVSTASACAATRGEPSHVLRAMGLGAREAGESIRISLGHTTREADVDRLLEVLPAVVHRARAGR